MSESSESTKAAHDTGPVFRLIYRSHSKIAKGSEPQELANILRVARTKNAAQGVTGALMLYDDWFAQVLEGPETAVRDIYGRIERDPRHDALDVRESSVVPARAFARWAMASVGEHGDPDTPLIATTTGLTEGAPWKPSGEQALVLTVLRDLTRGYGRGS